MKLGFLIKISRPRSWIYLFGPFLIGIIGAYPSINRSAVLIFATLYFTYPANFLVNAINDLFEYETGNKLKNKQYKLLLKPENRLIIYTVLFAISLITISLALLINWYAWFGLMGFLFFGIFYSAPPIRAKTKPVIDAIFSIQYVFPAVVSYGLMLSQFPPLQLVLAGILWCMAMYAFSVVPDIKSDKNSYVETIATVLGEKSTIIFCLVCYLLASALSYRWIGGFSLLFALLYGGTMLIALYTKDILAVHKWFSGLNIITATTLILWVLYIVK